MNDAERWWEPRRPGERTTVFLGRVLDKLDVTDMAQRARQGHFDDYFCPPDVDDGFNMIHLVNELAEQAKRPQCGAERRKRIKVMIEAVKTGEFDGTKEESDHWAATKQGQEVFRDLIEGR